MKNKILLASALLLSGFAFAQAPQKMSYQSVVRDNTNTLVTNTNVSVRVSILQGSVSGAAQYVESHTATTNANGLATFAIGTGTVISGSMASINWGAGPFYIKTETDPTGGTNYSIVGVSELMSTPYALYAANSAPGPQGPQGLTGPAGPQGVAGPQGPQGPAGNDGAVGPQGVAGPAGPVGPQGAVGPQGTQGPAGNDGAVGPQGLTGPAGPAGPQGVAGPQGPQGPAGNDGAVGPQGIAGPVGPQGATGPQGPQGPQGPAGNDGAVGPQGLTGPAGPAGPTGSQGPAGPVGGSNQQLIFNNNGAAAGSANNTWNDATSTHTVVGTSISTNERVTSLAGTGTRAVGADASGNLIEIASGISGTGNTNYITKWTNSTTLGNSNFQDNGTSAAINFSPQASNQLYVYRQQITANGDGQHTLMGYRNRNSQNDGTSYSQAASNTGSAGHSFWGDLYTFGVGGWNYNDFTRCGGTIGSEINGSYWGSLGYKSSASVYFGVYGSNAYGSGAGYASNNLDAGIGGGFFGMIGSISRGNIVGQFNKGSLFAAYNIGDVYTSGKNIELVSTGTEKTPAYSVTSTEAVIYKKGKAELVNGTATILFDSVYAKLLGDSPVVTVTPMGQCNGVYIESVTKEGFTIRELNSGNSTVTISWIAVGDRIDATDTATPAFVKEKSFDQKMDQVLFNDSDRNHSGEGIWWDGTTFQINKNYPRALQPTREEKMAKANATTSN